VSHFPKHVVARNSDSFKGAWVSNLDLFQKRIVGISTWWRNLEPWRPSVGWCNI
jgi:hypothetical protein